MCNYIRNTSFPEEASLEIHGKNNFPPFSFSVAKLTKHSKNHGVSIFDRMIGLFIFLFLFTNHSVSGKLSHVGGED